MSQPVESVMGDGVEIEETTAGKAVVEKIVSSKQVFAAKFGYLKKLTGG